MNRSFPTLAAAYNYANGLVTAGVTMQPSRVYADQLSKDPRNRHRLLLGVDKKAGPFCEMMAPGGTWGVEVEIPGTRYLVAGILGHREVQTTYHRCSAWYSRYLPYAYAMMKAEHDFRCKGVDFESINSYYGTCMGFLYLGRGDDNVPADGGRPAWNRIDPADVELYSEVYRASSEVRPPGLPFDEVYAPSLVYVALHRPEFVTRQCDPDDWGWQHVCKVFETLGRPRPRHPKEHASAKAR